MSKNEFSSMMSSVGRVLLAYAVIFSQSTFAGQNKKPAEKPDLQLKTAVQATSEKQSGTASVPKAQVEEANSQGAENSVAEKKPAGDEPHEGIKVHGHWTIEVRNSDGSLVTHREFENSLQASGATVLANVLNSGSVPGGWAIVLDGIPTSPWLSQPNNGFFLGLSVSDTSALIFPSGFFPSSFLQSLPDSNVFLNVISNNTGTGQLVVSGSALAAQSGSVSIVSTYLDTCGNVFSPTNCVNHTGGSSGFLFTQFTAVTLSSPVQVSAGQTVAATVTISFS